MLSFWCLLPEYSVWDSRLLHESKTHSKITIYNLIILKLLILSENFRFTFFYYGLDSVDLYLKLLTRFFQPFINSVRLLPKGHCSAEFVIWLREKLGICNSHRWENKLCEAEKRLFLMRCFVALRQWELQTPDLAGRMCGDCKSPQTGGGEGFGIRSGCLRVLAYEDAKAELFLREFRCLPYCAVAPEECVCYRHTILCWECVAVMLYA